MLAWEVKIFTKIVEDILQVGIQMMLKTTHHWPAIPSYPWMEFHFHCLYVCIAWMVGQTERFWADALKQTQNVGKLVFYNQKARWIYDSSPYKYLVKTWHMRFKHSYCVLGTRKQYVKNLSNRHVKYKICHSFSSYDIEVYMFLTCGTPNDLKPTPKTTRISYTQYNPHARYDILHYYFSSDIV